LIVTLAEKVSANLAVAKRVRSAPNILLADQHPQPAKKWVEVSLGARSLRKEKNKMILNKTKLENLVREVLEESHSKEQEEELKVIVGELEKASEMHAGQAKRIKDIVGETDDSELKEEITDQDKIEAMVAEELEAVLDEEKKKACKPSKGKRFAKRVDGKCRSYGQAGQAKGGGDRIRPGTAKGDAYCARSAKIKKCKNPPCANALSRKKWKCRGSKSMK